MNWFRMYSEFATDPKVQMMDEALQRRFIMLLCMRCGNVSETFHGTFGDAEIAFQMRISDEEVKRTKDEFLTRGLIDETWSVRAWERRQFIADSSTERVRKHRAKVKRYSNATVKRDGNVSVTPPDTDTDTERARAKAIGLTPSPVAASGAPAAINGFAPIIDTYHAALPRCTHVAVLNPKRKRRLAAVRVLAKQVCESQGWPYDERQFFAAYWAECAQDPWMRGEVANPNNPRWHQNLDVLLAEDRFAAVMDRAIQSIKAAQP